MVIRRFGKIIPQGYSAQRIRFAVIEEQNVAQIVNSWSAWR
jgi:hypothetical protein